MTETTEIAGLKDHNIRDFVNELRDAAVKYTGAQCMRDVISRIVHKHVGTLVMLLKAERQRSDDAERANRQQYRDLVAGQEIQKQLEAELAALKGDQVPVVLVDERQGSGGFCLTQHGRRLNLPHGTELFTVPHKTVVFPDINEDLVEILGRHNFTCSRVAELFRRNGSDIKRKSENEQAFVIHWLIGVYLTHGSEWRLVAEAELKAIADKIKAAARIVARDADKVDITCWSCRRFVTFQQHADTDGFCPHCNAEIELDDKVGQ